MQLYIVSRFPSYHLFYKTKQNKTKMKENHCLIKKKLKLKITLYTLVLKDAM